MFRLTALMAFLAIGLYSYPLWPRHRGRVIQMEATAFAQDGQPTSAGTAPHKGIVAADPRVLPFGSRIRVTAAGEYNGVYTVTDTGSNIRGRHIDLCLPSAAEAKQFGKKIVKVQVLQKGEGKEDARIKESRVRRPYR